MLSDESFIPHLRHSRLNGKKRLIKSGLYTCGSIVITDMEAAGIRNAEGVNFSVPRKSEMAGLLKQRMLNEQFVYRAA
jgi:hypothetical protein